MDLEKSRGKYNMIDSLNDENGVNSIKDEFDILSEIKKYHENISKSQLSSINVNSNVNDYLKDINHEVLSEQDRE